MLKSKQRLLLTLFIFIALGQSPEVHAAVGDITIDISGCSTITGTANPSFTFSAACPPSAPALTITGGTVAAISDTANGTLDIVKFTGTITANQDVSQAEIKITRVFTSGPDTTNGSVYYKTCANGTLTQDGGKTNNFALTGAVANPLGQLPRQMGVQIYYSSNQGSSFTCTVGSTTTTGQWAVPPDLTQNRLLQADLFVSIKAGGVMNLTGVNYIKIQSQGSPDDFPTPPGIGSPGQNSCLGLFTQCTGHSTTRLFSSHSEEVAAEDTKAKEFARAGWENLTADIARGKGEYLSSLASLLKVQPDDQVTFVALAQTHYRKHQEQGTLIPEAFVEGLRDEILATPHMGKVATFIAH